MAGIIEIWREEGPANMPVRFTLGSPPELPDGTINGPVIAKIDYRESGSMAGKRLKDRGADRPVFCITFEDSFVQRFIPADKVIDVAYETKDSESIKTPKLPE